MWTDKEDEPFAGADADSAGGVDDAGQVERDLDPERAPSGDQRRTEYLERFGSRGLDVGQLPQRQPLPGGLAHVVTDRRTRSPRRARPNRRAPQRSPHAPAPDRRP